MSDLSSLPHGLAPEGAEEDAFIEAGDTLEEINPEEGGHPMDEEDDEDNEGAAAGTEEVEMLNDSSQFFDGHKDSVFSIARHPKLPNIIATGGGDDVAYIWSSSKEAAAAGAGGEGSGEQQSQAIIFKLEGHKDSVTALDFTASGELLVAGGMDGRVSVVRDKTGDGKLWELLAFAHEVEEVNWVAAHPSDGTSFAVGANDGSVWVYSVNAAAKTEQLAIRHVFYKHQGSCTAGAWAQDGALLATVSEDGTLFVHDVESGEVKLNFGPEDQRFAIDGGLYSVAVNSAGTVAIVGGSTGECRVVSLPGASSAAPAAPAGKKTAGGKKAASSASGSGSGSGAAQGGIIAALAAQKESVETLAFSPTLPLLAAGSVDGTIVLYETGRWAVRRTIEAHSHAVVKVQFVEGAASGSESEWELLSCSTDGTLKKWDCRTGESKGVWKGHAEDTEGIMGFAQSKDGLVVTVGDDGVALIFQTA